MSPQIPNGPDDRYRRKFDYAPSQLWTPPGVRPPRRERGLMNLECPRCKVQFAAPKEYAMAICRAEKPPFIGDHRGCGWLLGLEPPFSSGSKGRAFAVIDMHINPETGRHDPKLYVQGFKMIAEEWTRRGLAKVETNSDGMIVGLQMPSADDLPSAAAPSDN